MGAKMELGVFGVRGFDQVNMRANLCRIPYVSMKIQEAQKVFDSLNLKHIDLMSTINDEAKYKTLTREFRNFILSLFAIGIYEKHLRNGATPEQFIVNENLELVIDFLKAELLGEKLPTRFLESYVRTIMRKGFFNAEQVNDLSAPVSYSLCTAHARWLHRVTPEEGGATMSYGLFFQFLSQSVREANVKKIIYFGPESEELHSLRKVVYDRWQNVEVASSIHQDAALSKALDFGVAVG
jgi:hypothetical protein